MSRCRLLKPEENFDLKDRPATPLFKDLMGRRFGRISIAGYAGRQGSQSKWACVCECGSRFYAIGPNLLRGNTLSCGCLHAEIVSASGQRHGQAKRGAITAEYVAYDSMVARCSRPRGSSCHYERGIRICDRWLFGDGVLSGVECFLSDMGRKPSPKHSLDRINNDGDYEPSNCRWATKVEQASNTTRNRFVNYRGEVITYAEAIRRSGVKSSVFYQRLRYGWTAEEALNLAERPRKRDSH